MTIYLTDSLIWFLVIATIVLAGFLGLIAYADFRRYNFGFRIFYLIYYFGLGVVAPLLIWRYANGSPTTPVRVIGGTLFILAVSTTLFALKNMYLRIYAFLEILFSIAFTGKTFYDLSDVITPLQSLSILASSYLLVRGFDNYRQGVEENNLRIYELQVKYHDAHNEK